MKKQDLYAIVVFTLFMLVTGLTGASDIAQYVI